MKYLFADSEPFPLSYPFLPTLDRFVRAAARALEAVTAIRATGRQLAEHRAQTVRTIERLDSFVASVLESVQTTRTRGDAEAVGAYAEELKSYIERSAQGAKLGRERELDHFVKEAQQKIEEQRELIRDALSEFLLTGHLVSVAMRYRLRLTDGRYRLWATATLPNDVEVGYRLLAERSPDWQAPRRVGSLVNHLELQVGMKKAWLSRDLTRERVRVDEHTVAAAVLDPKRAEIHLRKKADSSGDSLVLFLERGENGFSADIDRPAETGEPSRFHAVAEDLPQLEELWARLEASCASVDTREAVESLTIEGQDVFEEERVVTFIDQLLMAYAPIVSEIVRRSPSPRELSLKIEHSDGRREELYLKKDQLAGHLASLEPPMREHFARLDIFPKTGTPAPPNSAS